MLALVNMAYQNARTSRNYWLIEQQETSNIPPPAQTFPLNGQGYLRFDLKRKVEYPTTPFKPYYVKSTVSKTVKARFTEPDYTLYNQITSANRRLLAQADRYYTTGELNYGIASSTPQGVSNKVLNLVQMGLSAPMNVSGNIPVQSQPPLDTSPNYYGAQKGSPRPISTAEYIPVLASSGVSHLDMMNDPYMTSAPATSHYLPSPVSSSPDRPSQIVASGGRSGNTYEIGKLQQDIGSTSRALKRKEVLQDPFELMPKKLRRVGEQMNDLKRKGVFSGGQASKKARTGEQVNLLKRKDNSTQGSSKAPRLGEQENVLKRKHSASQGSSETLIDNLASAVRSKRIS